MERSSADVRRVWGTSHRNRRLVHRIMWIIVWCVGVVTVSKMHLDSVKMYIIISTLLLIFVSLGRMRKKRVVNAHDVPSPRVVDEVPRNISRDETPTATQLPISSVRRECAVFTALRNIGTPQALRAVRDKEFQDLILHTPPDSIQCCCGSGTRFARCCRVIQDALHQCEL
ncbi:uncharacterized protein TM35_000054260 [Trypanosoma theileri]|uniref:Uncharacterized protein n=1 Tax=Trypanosoma theileri TaxID=67003 RepID=A0A1X0P5X1_9TRYP|nr:uncharacterized protein TM35_000054260 [Trypanosoma theileri]ORC91830.1 hypothetical protein TM35_000054260 [Trypanosoma theileri]